MKAPEIRTHILLKLREGFPEAIVQEDHSLTVRPTLGCWVQALADSLVDHSDGGGAMDIAAGQSGSIRRTVHMEWPGIENEIKEKAQASNAMQGLWFQHYANSYKFWSECSLIILKTDKIPLFLFKQWTL